MTDKVAVAVLCVAVAGVGAQWLAWRLKLPAIVLLFCVGLAVGPGLQILNPTADFGASLQPVVGLAVAIVVFEGGLALDFRELRAAGEGVFRLTMVALPISFVLAAAAAWLLGGMAWRAALLFGAITVVTGPTVVLPLLRHTRLERRTASFLKWEAIVNDPVGALLAAIVLALMLAGRQETPAGLVLQLLGGLAVAAALGLGAAYLVRWLVTRDQAPENLKTPILLAMALGVYALSNLVMDQAGLAAATLFGIALANLHVPGIGELTRVKEALVVLIVSALFVVLTAGLDRHLFAQLSWPILVLTLAMIFVVRPAAILLATLRTGLSWQERALAGWIAPRGIVAAAVAGIASQKLAGAGFVGADRILPAVFALIAATMVLHGFSLAPLARMWKLTLGDRPGLAILGASPWSVEFAQLLHRCGVPVLLVDTYPGALQDARRRGVPVLQAELLSEHGEDALAERRVDYLVAATRNDVYNSLVCAKLAPELGRGRVFQLAPAGGEIEEWTSMKREWRGVLIGMPPLTFDDARKACKANGTAFVAVPAPDPKAEEAGKAASEPPRAAPALAEAYTRILVVRRNGDLAFATVESTEIALAAGDIEIGIQAPGGSASAPKAMEATSA